MEDKNYMFNKLIPHIGHSIEVVGYGKDNNLLYKGLSEKEYSGVSVECLDCNEVLIDYDKVDE